MRLIDADKFEVYSYTLTSPDFEEGVRSVLEKIDAAPTVDAVEVVRCKDCEYSYNISGWRRCSHGICCGRAVPPDFYCAEGKRKENDNGDENVL